jgi:hypothetical protein
MADDNEKEKLEVREGETQEQGEEKQVYLDQGRSLAVARDGAHQVVEFRAPSGQLELRVKLTEEGPVVVLESVKLELNAAESLDIKCRNLNIEASGETVIASKGEMKIKANGELDIDSPEDIRIRGKMIWLN